MRGTLTVNAGATADYAVSNAFGYVSGQSVNVLNINGGTVGGANVGNHFWNSFQLNMTGGTLYLGGGINEFHNPTITVSSSSDTAQILPVTGSAIMRLRDNTSALFNVANGSQAIDMLVDVPIIEQNTNSSNVNKIGDGRLALTASQIKIRQLNVAGGDVTLGAAGSVATMLGGIQVGNAYTGGYGSTSTLDIVDGDVTTAWIQMGNSPGAAITAIINQTGGSVRTTGHPAENAGVRLGHYPAGTTFYNLSGGTLLVDNGYYLTCAVDGTGTFYQTGGVATAERVVVNARTNGSGNGTFEVAGGLFNVGSGGIVNDGTGPAAVKLGGLGGTLAATATWSSSLGMTLSGSGADAITLDSNGNDITLSGVLSGSGGLNKAGAGTLFLTNAANTYGGVTTVEEGTLALQSTANNIASSTEIIVGDTSAHSSAVLDVTGVTGGFTLAATQTLSGFGTIQGDLSVAGTHAPGASPGVQTIVGDYTLDGTLAIEVGGTSAGSGYDQVLISAGSGTDDYDVVLNETTSILDLDFSTLSGSVPTSMLWIIQNDTAGTLDGYFSNYATSGMSVGQYDNRSWYIYYGADESTGAFTGGNDVLLTAVPEPTTLAMLAGLAGVGLLGWVRRRRQQG